MLELYNTGSVEVPGKARETLGILHPFLVMQVLAHRGKKFTVEFAFLDHSNTKRRIVFTGRGVAKSQLHARLPSVSVKHDVWVNLCFDVISLSRACFPSETYRHLDQVRVTAVCRLRRIFAQRLRLRDTTGELEEETYYYDSLPPAHEFPRAVTTVTQYIGACNAFPAEKPLYFSNSPPKVNRKFYPSRLPPRRSFFEDKSLLRVNKSMLPALPSRSPPKLREKREITHTPCFFAESAAHAVEVRHFTPPFVNVEGDCSTMCRYNPISRAYDAGG